MMIQRRIQAVAEDTLRYQAAVALIGPRQVGKTTLALGIAKKRDALYLDLEDSEDRAKLANPGFFLERMEDRLVILDEIHRMPELFQTLRGVIDKGRRKGKGIGRFLILGSASLDLMKQSGESLAGRIAYIDMTPLTALEGRARAGSARAIVATGRFSPEAISPGTIPRASLSARTSSELIWSATFPCSGHAFRRKRWNACGPCWRIIRAGC